MKLLRLALIAPLYLLLLLVSAQEGTAPPVRTFAPYPSPSAPIPVDTPVVGTGEQGPAPGSVTIIADPRIDKLMQDFTTHKQPQRGYRVQIFLGDRKTAEETKRAFLQKYPDMPAYLSWLAPNFRLRVGDLRTRLEAERLLRDIKVQFPGSYIVPDDIEMPALEGM